MARRKRRRQQSSSARTLNWVLGIVLLAFVGYHYLPNIPLSPTNDNPPAPQSKHPEELEKFFQGLQLKKGDEWTTHEEIGRYLSSPDKLKQIDTKNLSQIPASKIPGDYSYFIKEALPTYLASGARAAIKYTDDKTLFSAPAGEKYESFAFFNRNKLPVQRISSALPLQQSDHRLIMTATYTSPYGMPTGLCISGGKVINPFLQKWDGMILIQNGKIRLAHIDQLPLPFSQIDIKRDYNHYKAFLEMATTSQMTVLQSHLLVDRGKVAVGGNSSARKMRRRVIFQTKDQGLHIYDSMDDLLSLKECAEILVNQYKANVAINLDMGGYNFFTHIKKNGQTEDLSELFQGVILSNLLVIDY
ncbi:MAG: hypothetical protein AAFY71_10080 [Bacteroidota bacterium]